RMNSVWPSVKTGEDEAAIGLRGKRFLGLVAGRQYDGSGRNHGSGRIRKHTAQDSLALGGQHAGRQHYYCENLPAGHVPVLRGKKLQLVIRATGSTRLV